MPIGIDPAASQIPLETAFQPVSVAGATQDAYALANQKLETDQNLDAKRDKDAIQQYLRSGGDLFDQEGITKAATELKGKVSPKTYMGLVDYGNKFQEHQADMSAKLANATDAQIGTINSRYDLVAKTMAPTLQAYDADWQGRLKARGLDPKTAPQNEIQQAQQDALPAFNAAKQARLQQLGQLKAGGQAPVDDKFLQSFSQMGPDEVRGTLQYTNFYQGLLKDDQKRRLEESQIGANDARAKASGSDPFIRELLAAGIDPESTEGQKAVRDHIAKQNTPTGSANTNIMSFEKLPPEQQKAVDAAAWNKIIDNKDPPARGGMYAQTMAYMEDIAKENNMSTQDLLTASADIKTRLQAKRGFEQRVLNLSRAEDVMANETPVMEQNMKAIDLSKYPDISHIDLFYLRHAGDPNVVKLDQSAEAILNEFQGIVTGNVGGALNVGDVQKAAADYQKIQTPQGMEAWITNARQMVERAKVANDKTRKDWMEGINKTIGGKSPLTRLQGGGATGGSDDRQRILQDELTTAQAQLAKVPPGSPEAAQAQASVDELGRELGRLGVKPGATAPPPASPGAAPLAGAAPAAKSPPPPNARTTINGRPVEWVGKSAEYPSGYRYKDVH